MSAWFDRAEQHLTLWGAFLIFWWAALCEKDRSIAIFILCFICYRIYEIAARERK